MTLAEEERAHDNLLEAIAGDIKRDPKDEQDFTFCQNCQKVSAIIDTHFCANCGEMICLDCGCTDTESCAEPCEWSRSGICSNCAEHGERKL